ncbi:MAG: HNH endonuclease signature motif containing protein [Pseudomonadota bacterium]|nr:HNH endonuclease signature motif containing protein [Pseudomonadota bacterium]
MPSASVSFGQFCIDLGIPQRSAYSWCSVNRKKKQALFTIWDNEIDHDNNCYEFWNFSSDDIRLADPDGRKTKNPKEFIDILNESLDGGYQTLGVRCIPNYPLTVPRSRRSYFSNELLAIQLERTSAAIVGKFKGTIGVAAFMSGLSVPQSMNRSAIDDLDASDIGDVSPPRAPASGTFFVRDERVRKRVIKRAKGRCEFCGELGFRKSDGTHYVEAHHIISLAKQGPDTLDNVIALCPSHHREAHFGEDWELLEAKLKGQLAKIRGN